MTSIQNFSTLLVQYNSELTLFLNGTLNNIYLIPSNLATIPEATFSNAIPTVTVTANPKLFLNTSHPTAKAIPTIVTDVIPRIISRFRDCLRV